MAKKKRAAVSAARTTTRTVKKSPKVGYVSRSTARTAIRTVKKKRA